MKDSEVKMKKSVFIIVLIAMFITSSIQALGGQKDNIEEVLSDLSSFFFGITDKDDNTYILEFPEAFEKTYLESTIRIVTVRLFFSEEGLTKNKPLLLEAGLPPEKIERVEQIVMFLVVDCRKKYSKLSRIEFYNKEGEKLESISYYNRFVPYEKEYVNMACIFVPEIVKEYQKLLKIVPKSKRQSQKQTY